MRNITHNFISLEALAAELCLPKSYLKVLAAKKLIPSLNVNGRLRFNIVTVKQALDELTQGRSGDE
jgi:hypothetical protein